MSKLDLGTQRKVLARIARGDAYEAIRADLAREGITITVQALSGLKRRNMTAIDYIKNEVTKHEANQSVKILGKSRQLLERKLDRALKQAEQMENIKQRYDNDEIDAKDYDRLLSQAVRSELSVSELTSLTKEMFNQSRLEEGKATSITESPTQAKEHLKTLLQAINDKDDHKLVEAIFTDA